MGIMNTLMLLVIIVLICVAVDIVNLIITMQLMARIGDLVADLVIVPSREIQGTVLTEFGILHVI